jgi:hypothetical protein
MKVVRLSALRTGHLITPRDTPGPHMCHRLSRPRVIVRLDGLCQWKFPVTRTKIRTRDLPACSAVPQPTAVPRAPRRVIIGRDIRWELLCLGTRYKGHFEKCTRREPWVSCTINELWQKSEAHKHNYRQVGFWCSSQDHKNWFCRSDQFFFWQNYCCFKIWVIVSRVIIIRSIIKGLSAFLISFFFLSFLLQLVWSKLSSSSNSEET